MRVCEHAAGVSARVAGTEQMTRRGAQVADKEHELTGCNRRNHATGTGGTERFGDD